MAACSGVVAHGAHRDISGSNQLRFSWVEIAYIDHYDAISRQCHIDTRIDAPLRQCQACTDGNWHATEHPRQRCFGGVEVTMSVKPH
jgi:hypothetical protein